MATRTLAYECKYCGALKRTKNVCERHEFTCLQNVDAKNCLLCQNVAYKDRSRVCKLTDKKCSVAVSASCEHFVRKIPR